MVNMPIASTKADTSQKDLRQNLGVKPRLEISLSSPTPQGSGMRRPRVRLTVRALTIVVAVAALLTSGFVLARRSAHYRREALYHSRAAARAAGAKERMRASRGTPSPARWLLWYWRRRAS